MHVLRMVHYFVEFPRPDLPNEFKVVTLGSDTMLTCTVPDAYPKIVMTWWEKNNIRLERSFEVHTVNNFSIQNVDPRDLGEYRCCANNTKGTNCSNQILLGGESSMLIYSLFFRMTCFIFLHV